MGFEHAVSLAVFRVLLVERGEIRPAVADSEERTDCQGIRLVGRLDTALEDPPTRSVSQSHSNRATARAR